MQEYYLKLEPILVQTQLILVMFGMGTTHSLSEFQRVLKRPASLCLGFVCMYLMTPLLALLVNRVFSLPPGIAFGLILVSVMPGGSLSNVFTYLGKGNVPLAILMTALSTVGSIVTVPTLLKLFTTELDALNFSIPIDWVFREIGLYLLIPLGAGMLVHRIHPVFAERLTPWSLRGGLAALGLIIVGSLASGRIEPGSQGWKTPLAIILFCVVSQQITILLFRFLKLPSPDRLAAAMKITVRNVNLALLLSLLPSPNGESIMDRLGPGVLFVILFYGATSLITSLPPIAVHRRLLRRQTARSQAQGNVSPAGFG